MYSLAYFILKFITVFGSQGAERFTLFLRALFVRRNVVYYLLARPQSRSIFDFFKKTFERFWLFEQHTVFLKRQLLHSTHQSSSLQVLIF